jgi:putative two-component system response regulator
MRMIEKAQTGADWVLVVDDDSVNLHIANRILASGGIRASCVRSGEMALRMLRSEGKVPDLVLLDLHMSGMDGFETLSAMRENPASAAIPVIFLTAEEDSEAEARALDEGALDFIRKPFAPKVLLTRVHHAIELTRLQNDLEKQVEEKTRAVVEQQEQIVRINEQVVRALSGAVDAKDAYTNGHSERVAKYAREIARRSGWSGERQKSIYLIGLLHDIGKIGIPDEIINKAGRLTDEEYAVIKTHPVQGDRILHNISEFPELAIGARWHHERWDGTGYPDGIAGNDIPEEARIISVADAYDAMASRRSYRGVLSQETIRAEIEKGRSAQFDPAFAEIMLQMIAEDTGFRMREE